MAPVIVIRFVFLLLAVLKQGTSAATQSGLILLSCNDSPFPKSTDPCVERCKTRPRRDDYIYTEGVGAHKFITQHADWNTARRTCEQDGAHLVIINSVAEAEAVVRLLNSSNAPSSHVGVHDLYQEGEFVTILDQALIRTGFSVWREGEPNNGGGENCVAIFSHDTKLNDIPCEHRSSFVCELPYTHPVKDPQQLESSPALEHVVPNIA